MSASDEIRDELFLMVNLSPRMTGLPMVVWASPSYNAPHDIRVKVMMAHGSRMDPHNLAVVGLRPNPHVVHGQLTAADLRAITAWWQLNEAALLGYWDSTLDTDEFIQQLRPLSPPLPP